MLGWWQWCGTHNEALLLLRNTQKRQTFWENLRRCPQYGDDISVKPLIMGTACIL
jgi:hypothetical protein